MTNPENEKSKISIAHMPELIQNLRGGIETTDGDYLRSFAEDLLQKCGQEATINGRPATVTKYACEIDGDNVEDVRTFYVRAAQFEAGTQPFIVFGQTSDSRRIRARSPMALTFSGVGEGTMVISNRGMEPIENDPEEVALVGKILENIGEQYADSKHRVRRGLSSASSIARDKSVELREWSGVAKQRIREYYSDGTPYEHTGNEIFDLSREDDTVGNRRLIKAAAVAGIGAVLYGHMVPSVMHGNFGDARIFSIIPLPQPIELIVDWNNHVDHVAQGFDEPDGAATAVVGQPIDHIPLLSDYITLDVPDASYSNMGGYQSDESRPGLYKSDFDASYHGRVHTDSYGTHVDRNNAEFNDQGCYTILGDYTDGKSTVFTQTAGLDEKIELRVRDAESLDVCLKNPKDTTAKGSVYVWQNW